jgi:hypothetical protein
VFFDGAFRQVEVAGGGGVAVSLRDLGEDLSFAVIELR